MSSPHLLSYGPDVWAGLSRVCAWRDSLVAAGEFTLSTWDSQFCEALWTPAGWLAWDSAWVTDHEPWNNRLFLAVAYNFYMDATIYSRRSAIGAATQIGVVDGSVLDLAQWDGALLAVGYFTSINGVPLASVARYNGTSWSGVGGGAGSTVHVACAYGDDLVIGGSFIAVGGVPAARIARWDGTAWWPLGQGLNGTVYALLADGPCLVAGGSFTQAGGLPAANVAVWDGERWWPLGSGTNGQVRALELYQGDLHVGGEFTRAGGHPAGGFTRWEGSLVTGVGDGAPAPRATAITAVAPNPFNPRTEVTFALDRPGAAEICVYDVRGRRVAMLHRGETVAGVHRVAWDGTDARGGAAPSGTYLVRLLTDLGASSRKVVLVR
jgi:hypothetical protein